MKNFLCSFCNKKHDIFFETEFGLPEVIVKELDSGELEYESGERWFIIQKKYFLVKGVIEIPIIDYEKKIKWLVWAMISKEDFFEYTSLFSTNKKANWPKEGTLAAEMAFLKKSVGLRISLDLKEKNSFPSIKICERDSELGRMQEEKITMEGAIKIMELFYHDELKFNGLQV
ncbi:MAG: DUF2199 domain-containing protein [Phaeodactylibacter sp.]|nr:DUF2199 domain-containing protein [Phaeodactylibacter sp.]MCB9304248.1 DUF2199 domain-containing protein [Lewinellaceae bacterium]